uniref:G-protein coupled receptors family 1 profile domain-containing protein n=1 Tax=Pyxicephalus adspersus TaxID=30357 RepID=A0AAV2ZY63_PYXAD|nr:TPA: hypothetical protein GDO54_015065 [Pyxicephalus adspersus]
MESNTSILEFYILPFFFNTESKLYIFNIVFFFLIYCIGILINLTIIAVICLDIHLHTPMYIFLCNLSVIDIFYTTTIVPKLLHILLSQNNTISFTECFIQIYIFYLVNSNEAMVILTMAYDRYVAICHPLDYHRILNKKNCILLITVTWISGSLNSSLFTSSILKIIFCSSLSIHQFFCDPKALFNISCGGTKMFYIMMCADLIIFGLSPTVCNLMSYIKIIRVILRIKSKEGRRKAFSTCSSHLTVMVCSHCAVLPDLSPIVSGQTGCQLAAQLICLLIVTHLMVMEAGPGCQAQHQSTLIAKLTSRVKHS